MYVLSSPSDRPASMGPLCTLIGTVALASASLHAVDVHVVDAAGGVGADFTSIQAAVDAASTGDIVLVRDGVYGSVDIAGKGLLVFADGEAPSVQQVVVRDLAVNQPVVLRGLVGGVEPHDGPLLRVSDAVAPVVVEDAALLHVSGGVGPAVSIEDSADVALVRCVMLGGDAVGAAYAMAGPGADIRSSTVTMYGCEFTGGQGVGAGLGDPDGAPAVVLHASTVFVAGSECVGGPGAMSSGDGQGGCSPAGMGGPGVASSGASIVRSLDAAMEGGAAGLNLHAPACPDASPGPPMVGDASFEHIAGHAFSLSAPSVLRELRTGILEISGMPGDLVLLVLSTDITPVYLEAHEGVLLPNVVLMDAVGYVNDAGTFELPISVPPLPAGVDGLGVCLQAGLADGQGPARLAEPTALAMVDATF